MATIEMDVFEKLVLLTLILSVEAKYLDFVFESLVFPLVTMFKSTKIKIATN